MLRKLHQRPTNRGAIPHSANSTIVMAILWIWCASHNASNAESPPPPDEIARAKAIYREAIDKAKKSPKAEELQQELAERVNRFRVCCLEAGLYEAVVYDEFGRPIFRPGVAGIANRVGNLAAKRVAERQIQQHKQGIERTSEKLNEHLASTAWKSLDLEARELCIRTLPEFVRQAGEADRLPPGPGGRPGSWMRYKPEGANYQFWLPAKAEIAKDKGRIYATDKATTTEYVVASLDLPPMVIEKFRESKHLIDIAEGSAKKSGGAIVSSKPCVLQKEKGHEVTYTLKIDGIDRILVTRTFILGSAITTFTVNRSKANDMSPEADWYFSSIEPH